MMRRVTNHLCGAGWFERGPGGCSDRSAGLDYSPKMQPSEARETRERAKAGGSPSAEGGRRRRIACNVGVALVLADWSARSGRQERPRTIRAQPLVPSRATDDWLPRSGRGLRCYHERGSRCGHSAEGQWGAAPLLSSEPARSCRGVERSSTWWLLLFCSCSCTSWLPPVAYPGFLV